MLLLQDGTFENHEYSGSYILRVYLVELWLLKKLLWALGCRKAAASCGL